MAEVFITLTDAQVIERASKWETAFLSAQDRGRDLADALAFADAAVNGYYSALRNKQDKLVNVVGR